ncbi:MAG TPA: hypothetical protein VEX37_01720 [Thermomicrobiales bacterium]|nr:hypothetical protein [Thermomicrobiales bacterium]
MSDDEQIQRSRLARRVFELWGEVRVTADAGLIESASQALARMNAMTPQATIQLDVVADSDRD